VNPNSLLAFTAACFSGALAVLVSLRKQRSIVSWCFALGMATLSVESVFEGFSLQAQLAGEVSFWQTLALITKSFLPGVWLCFSLTYSRGNYREFLGRSRILLLLAFLLPVGIALGFRDELAQVIPYNENGDGWWLRFGAAAKVLNAVLLVSTVLILVNLERTFRSAVGTMQWRIKFMVLGLGIVFGARIYTRSQALLFSGQSLSLTGVETSALLIGCTLIAVAYFRSGLSEIDVYPSRAVLHTSVTVLLVGGYLFVVGVLAQIVARTGGSGSFQLQSFLVLLGIAGLAVLLLSAKVRQKIQHLISRHFKRPQHDFRRVWTLFTRSVSSVFDQSALCASVARLISETFNVLSVTIWLFDEQKERLVLAASTSQSQRETSEATWDFPTPDASFTRLRKLSHPFDLEKAKDDWAETLRRISASQFRKGGNRICVPLLAGDRSLGFAVLADRVAGTLYTVEELDLLKCIGDQVATSLLNLRLTKETVMAKELEAFQTMSAFFVHDLKNAASTLSLMLQNLPVHFDDPAFRQDALNAIGNTANRINQLIEGLGVLRRSLELKLVEFDLNLLLEEGLASVTGVSEIEWIKQLHPLPKLVADRTQLQSVVTNLLLNACDAVGAGGKVTVETSQRGEWAALTVADNGCGMSPAFLRDSLFRPFQTTKTRGLGIGMFQSKMVVEAHGGNIQVKSELGVGTTFRVMLPLASQTS
jgi:putative PEP-CTERM system histidine kinase